MATAMQDDLNIPRKRPIWVWLISLYFILWVGWTLLSFLLIWAGIIPLEPEQKAYFARLTVIDYAATIIIGLINFSAAVALFLLRKISVGLFLAGLVLSLVIIAWQTAAKGWVEAIGGAGMVGALIGYVLVVVVCIYAWRLSRKGVLR